MLAQKMIWELQMWEWKILKPIYRLRKPYFFDPSASQRYIWNNKCTIEMTNAFFRWEYYVLHVHNYGIWSTYPSPENSGMYLPQPRSGGRVSTKESSHIVVIILKASWYDDTFPLIRPAYKKFFILAIDNTQRVIIDAKPKTKFAHMNMFDYR